MSDADFTGFPPQTFEFLRQLAAHNERDWFQEHKAEYEQFVRTPALQFITAMKSPLRKVSRFLEADPRKTGGSLIRIYRDTRFSKDKTPYKIHIGMQFRHEAGFDIHAPGAYIH